jgi:hypothetical protein
VRIWIEQWEMSLDDIDLELPEALAEIELEEQAGELEGSQKAHGVRVRPSLGMNPAGQVNATSRAHPGMKGHEGGATTNTSAAESRFRPKCIAYTF